MADNIDVEKLLEALGVNAEKAADALGRMGDETDIATEKYQDSIKTQRDVQKEFDKLGLVLEKTVTVEGEIYTTRKKSEEQLKKRNKLDEETNKLLEQTQAGYKSLTQAQKEEELSRMRSKNLLDQQLESMNRVIDKNGKLVDLSVRMNQADLLRLTMVQRQEAAIKKHEAALSASANALMDLPKKLGVIALQYAFNRLIGTIDATYKGMVAYEDALLEGRTGETNRTIVQREQMQAQADASKALGDSMKNLGGTMVATGAQLMVMGGPIGMVVGGLTMLAGGLSWLFGRQKEQDAKATEYAKKRLEDQGKQSEKLFDGYEKLSEATLVGARGLSGMFDDLQKVGLTVSQFEKLNKVLQASQKDMTLFGAGAVDGAKKFAEQAGELLNSKLGAELRAMGISQEEQMAHMANFMAMQSKTGLKASGDQAKAAANYIKELDKMALITGQTRKEAEDSRKALLSMNQLRAAILKAEKSGDTKELERLNRYLETATDLYKTDPEYAGAIAKYAASGVTDAITAQVAMSQGGKGGALEMLDTGKGTRAERAKAVAGGVMATESKFADVTAITGGVSGVTVGEGKLGGWMDLEKGITKIDDAARKASKSLDEFAEGQRKPNKDAIEAANLRIEETQKAIALDKQLREGKLGEAHAASLQHEAVSDTMSDFSKWWAKYGIGGEVDQKNWEITKKTFSDMWEGTKKMTDNLSVSFTSLGETLGKSITDAINGIMVAIKNLISMIPNAGAVVDKAKQVGGAAVDMAKGAASSVAGAASSAWGGVTSAFGGGGGGSAGGGGGRAVAAPSSGGSAPSGGGGRASGGGVSLPSTGSGGGRGRSGGAGASSESVPPAAPGAMGTETGGTVAPAAGGGDIVQMGDSVRVGNELRKGGTVSWRTNNPGNNSYSDLAKKFGAIGTWKKLDGDAQQRSVGIAIMPSLEAGDALKMAQWRRPKYTHLDIDHGVSQWTNGDPNKNLGTAYAKDLAKAAGVTLDTLVGDLSDTQLKAMITKQRVWEGFKPGSVVSASLEGIAKGPESGYAAQLHGTELIKRLTPNSILDQLANTPANSVAESKSDGTVDILADLHQLMEDKFNTMIAALRDGNDLTDKLIKYSMV